MRPAPMPPCMWPRSEAKTISLTAPGMAGTIRRMRLPLIRPLNHLSAFFLILIAAVLPRLSLAADDAREPVSVSIQPDPIDDWPETTARRHADLIVETIASPWLDPTKSMDLITTAGRIAAWRRDGASWVHDVLPVIEGLVGKKQTRIGSWKFFDAAIAQSIADNRAALEIPQARAQGPPGGSFLDQITATNAEARRIALAATTGL